MGKLPIMHVPVAVEFSEFFLNGEHVEHTFKNLCPTFEKYILLISHYIM